VKFLVSQVGLCCMELTPPHPMQCGTDTHKATHNQTDYAEKSLHLTISQSPDYKVLRSDGTQTHCFAFRRLRSKTILMFNVVLLSASKKLHKRCFKLAQFEYSLIIDAKQCDLLTASFKQLRHKVTLSISAPLRRIGGVQI